MIILDAVYWKGEIAPNPRHGGTCSDYYRCCNMRDYLSKGYVVIILQVGRGCSKYNNHDCRWQSVAYAPLITVAGTDYSMPCYLEMCMRIYKMTFVYMQ